MFYDFKNSLQRHKKKEVKVIPQEVLNVLTEPLIGEYEYKDIGGGLCAIFPAPDNDRPELKLHLSNFKVLSPTEAIEITNGKDLCEFVANTRQAVEISVEDTTFKFGENIISSDNFIISVRENTNKWNSCTCIIKPKKPKPIKMLLQIDDKKLALQVQQIKSKDWTKKLYKSAGDKSFVLEFSYDIKEHKLTVKNKLVFKGEYKSSQILNYLYIRQALFNQKLKVNGYNLFAGQIAEKDIDDEGIAHAISWWEKVLLLEKKLDLEIVCKMPLRPQDEIILRLLYIGLCMEQYCKETVGIKDFEVVSAELDEMSLKKMDTVSVIQDKIFEQFNIKKPLYKREILTNIKVDSVRKLRGKNKYLVKIAKGYENKVIRIIRYYLSREEAQKNMPQNLENVNFFDEIILD